MKSKYYRNVKTQDDYNAFYDLLIPSFQEMGYILECPVGNVSRILSMNDEGEYTGTGEFIPYTLDERTPINQYFPFHKNPFIQANVKHIVELDGICIHKDFRGTGTLDYLFYGTLEIGRKSNIQYIVCVLNPSLYIALKSAYRVPIERLGKRIQRGKYSLYPCLLNCGYIYRNVREFPWLYNIYEKDNNLARDLIYSPSTPEAEASGTVSTASFSFPFPEVSRQ
ncbi:hypothetical protein JOC95_000375 [Bacillus tianshenii]|uniref:N-acetyltransferase domain-containing protein n=1 Tax=Sutcliffiella tianshenii TaxID=1463404 RepID=A0ABS2NVH2_9BACI|nr:hypothetical protein [Bacillus tianshenii]MBM7618533.1 hypothetical protein [Bacillus tianshenii]